MDRQETTGAEGFLPEDDDMEDLRVTLTMEDDSEVECRILTIFECEDQDYIALLPQDENGDDSEDAEVLLFRYFEDEDGEPSLENIEEEDEFDEISEIFLQLVEDEAWEED
ncbi:MAG: DUF1292 domain-containing protein [Lachnospiraceae bacterium]|jgi:uncharacterized protein YrzB (UPF0473 family)|nr:DUF1292 domain-containing protein [Lachnospiraceae bacterium]